MTFISYVNQLLFGSNQTNKTAFGSPSPAHVDTSVHGTTNPIKLPPITSPILNQIAAEIYQPDVKTNCAIAAQGYAHKYAPSGFKYKDADRTVAEETKARYTVIAGGGDGAGMEAQATVRSLADYYECDPSYFQTEGPNRHARIVQVSFSSHKDTLASQLAEFRARLDRSGFDIVTEKQPLTDFRCLRDGVNNERERQGTLCHFIVKPKANISTSELAERTRSLISSFNVEEKRKDLLDPNYHPAVMFGASQDSILCKSFKGDSISDLFKFLSQLKIVKYKFHGREATNTGPQLFSMHPMSDLVVRAVKKDGVDDLELTGLSLVHNGEINNIKTLRSQLSHDAEFKRFIDWDDAGSRVSLFEILINFSDTDVLTKYISYCTWKGESIVDVLRRIIIPDTVKQNASFNVEGPAFIVVSDGDKNIFMARDPQGQRPGNLEVAKDESGRIIAYRIGSIAGIDTPIDKQFGFKWKKLDLPLGRVCQLKPVFVQGKIQHFEFVQHQPFERKALTQLPEDLSQSQSSRTDLAENERLHEAMMDETVKIAMGDQSIPKPVPRVCTAGITNTSSSPGINVAHPNQYWHLGDGVYTELNPVVSHDRMESQIQSDPKTHHIDCTIPAHTAKDIIDSEMGLDKVMDDIVDACKRAISAGATTLHLDFINGKHTPIYPRELLVYRISSLLVELNREGLSDPDHKVNILVSTHMNSHAQDVFTLMAAGADAVYFPHLTDSPTETYVEKLKELRSELMVLSMRAGVSRITQLTRSGLFYYQYCPEIAKEQYVINRGGDIFNKYDSFRMAHELMRGVYPDLGTNRSSTAQRLTAELAMLMKEADSRDAVEESLASTIHSPTIMVPTKVSTLAKTIVVLGGGAAGVSIIESLPPNLYNIVWVESDDINRGGNASYISGAHKTMYEGLLIRLESCLKREDLTYCGGLRRSARLALAESADLVIDCRGSEPVDPPEGFMPIKGFLSEAYAGEAVDSKSKPIAWPRAHRNVFFLGHGETAYDAVKAYFGEDERCDPNSFFSQWVNKFNGHGLYLTSRGTPDDSKWVHSHYHELSQIAKEQEAGDLRIFSSHKESVPEELQQYWHSLPVDSYGLVDLPTDGINFLFETTVDKFDPKTGNVEVDSQGKGVKVPYVGLAVQGFDPVKQKLPLGEQFGWATGQSSSMAGIADQTEGYVPKFDLDHLSIEERKARLNEFNNILAKFRFVTKEQQIAVIRALQNDPYMKDEDIVRTLKDHKVGGSASISSAASEAKDLLVENESPPKKYDEWLESIIDEEDMMTVIIEPESPEADPEKVQIPVVGADSTLDAIARHFNINIETDLSCQGKGTCSECTAVFSSMKPVKLPLEKSREASLVKLFKKKYGLSDPKTPARTSCQIMARKVVVANGSHLHGLISKRGLHTLSTLLRRIK